MPKPHICSTADISFWRAVNAFLVSEHGEAPAVAGEVRDFFRTGYTPGLAAELIARERRLAIEAVL